MDQAQREKGLTQDLLDLYDQIVTNSSRRKLLSELQDTEAQAMVDFLDRLLGDDLNSALPQYQKKLTLHLLSKLAKSAQIFPKSLFIGGVRCDLTHPVAQGGYADIYKGEYEGHSICVKAVRIYQRKEDFEPKLRAQAGELIIWAHLSHPSVLPFYGIYFSSTSQQVRRVCLVSPWMEYGDLLQYLSVFPDSPRISLLHDIISGLQYLHKLDVVHADLKAKNVLISETKRAMLADFGVSRPSVTGMTTATGPVIGTLHWMAPELLLDAAIPKKESDIWAFGCTCYEVLTGQMPFHQFMPAQLMKAFVRESAFCKKPETPTMGTWDKISNSIWSAAKSCWKYDPKQRPKAENLLSLFAKLNSEDNRLWDFEAKTRINSTNVDYEQISSILRRIRASEKGHGGISDDKRSSEQLTAPRPLTLTEDDSPCDTSVFSSPTTRPHALSNEGYVSPRRHYQTSNARNSWAPSAMLEHIYRHNNGHSATHDPDHHRLPLHSIAHSPQIPSPHSLVQPWRSPRHHYRHHPYWGMDQRLKAVHLSPNWTPAKWSAISPSYNWNDTEMAGMMDMAFFMQEEGQSSLALPALDWTEFSSGANSTMPDPFDIPEGAEGASHWFLPIPMNVDSPFRIQDVVDLLQRYKTEVVTVQYLLGTEFIRSHITNTIASDELTSEQQAAALLSKVHFLRFSRPPNELILRDQTDVRLHLHQVENLLKYSIREPKPEDAMAALHLISVVLFDGGHDGKWRQYLDFAARYVKYKMRGSVRYENGGVERLKRLDDKEAFIVKTSIWFDVLASVTTNESPLLVGIIRSLFKPGQSSLTELSNPITTATGSGGDLIHTSDSIPSLIEDKTSMISPMGCENRVVWALSEISVLAKWKRQLEEKGKLPITELVLRSKEIEKELETKSTIVKVADDFPDITSYSQYLTSNLFRASALLYLHAVVNGGYPHIIPILMAVDEAMRWIQCIPRRPVKPEDKEIHRTVVRSAVFAFYITGALTDHEKFRKTIADYLMEEAGMVMGNCKVTMEVLNEIWSERKSGGLQQQYRDEVMWREKLMRKDPEELILLV